MKERMINMFGNKSVYIEHNDGIVCIGNYVEQANEAFANQSFELESFAPKITPKIQREEVGQILRWIAQDTQKDKPNRVSLLYGSAGVGKSVVMHDVLVEAEKNADYVVLGLKSDQIEFRDTADLSRRMNLSKSIVSVIKDIAKKVKRVVLLIDQIDALSLSLSSNRTPLRSICKLIEQVKGVPHVRVVISCRPYDLEYDPILNDMNIPVKWKLKNFSGHKVMEVLKVHGADTNLADSLIEFLGNPLHLYLYLKVIPHGIHRSPITEEVLYDELWRIYVRDVDGNKVNKEKVLNLLDIMVETMYKRQELSIHKCKIETIYIEELRYLLSQELVLLNQNGRVQFFHQTMFDYVYARRFVETGKNLLEELSTQHQGLFSRAAVKSILTFLRETDLTRYIQDINSLLFTKKENGSDKFRFHLKSLALSNMTFFDRPKDAEIQLISRKIFDNNLYMSVIIESVHTGVWLEVIWSIIEQKGGWPALSKDYKENVITMCSRTLWSDADKMLDVIFRILSYGDNEDRKLITGIINYQHINSSVNRLIKLYQKIGDEENSIAKITLLKCIAKKEPAYVCNVFKKNIEEQLSQKKESSLHTIELTHGEESILEMLENENPDMAIRLYVELLTMIMEATKFDLLGAEISTSFEFSHFQRSTGRHFYRDFVGDVTNKLIDYLLKSIDTKEAQSYLSEFSQSNLECFVFIALYVYTQHYKKFVDDIYTIISQRSVLSNAPSWVEYQALEALKVSFADMRQIQQKRIVEIAETLTDEGERHFYKKLIERRPLAVYPICDIDLHRGKVLYALPKVALRQYSWNAYQECLRIERKFAYKRNGRISYSCLENEMPFRSSTMSGWTSVGADNAVKMSNNAWYISMKKYVDNRHTTDWNRPSLIGQCQMFRKVVSQNPDRYLQLINKITADDKVLLDYVEAGLRGLLDAKKYVEAAELFGNIESQIKGDVNSKYRGFDIHSLLYAIDEFVNGDNLPQNVFSFLCNAVQNLLESDVPTEIANERDIYNTAINQARGHAAYLLVKCCNFVEYKDGIFETIEQIATTASVYTRSAILLNMAVLNHLDKARNLRLFKLLMHDYDVRLMSLPIHNYNPLVYFVNYGIDDLMDFFKHAIEKPECYKEQVVLLWLAWTHNSHRNDIKVLLDKMCEKSETARIALMDFFGKMKGKLGEDVVSYIVLLMKSNYVSPNLGEAYDMIFHNSNNWSVNEKRIIGKAYVESPLSAYLNRGFLIFLASYAIIEPLRSLSWLECILEKKQPEDYEEWNLITDILIQSYNGILSFNDNGYQDTLEKAMDLMDKLMMSKDKRFLITNFIQKIDEE